MLLESLFRVTIMQHSTEEGARMLTFDGLEEVVEWLSTLLQVSSQSFISP